MSLPTHSELFDRDLRRLKRKEIKETLFRNLGRENNTVKNQDKPIILEIPINQGNQG